MFAYFLKLLIAAGCALFAYYMYGETDPPSQYLYIGFFGLLGLMAVWPEAGKRRKIAKLGGFSWNREDFCRGWLITEDTGSGKTTSGVISLAEQVYRHDPHVGGIVIDDKGVLFESFAEILKAKGRKKDVILLQAARITRRPIGCPNTASTCCLTTVSRQIPWPR